MRRLTPLALVALVAVTACTSANAGSGQKLTAPRRAATTTTEPAGQRKDATSTTSASGTASPTPRSATKASAVTPDTARVGDALPRPADPARPAVMITQGWDVPNPYVLYDGGRYYLYTSQTRFWTPNVSLRIADDPTRWPAEAREVMPKVPPWAREGFTWAPDVRRIGSRYVLYFNAALMDAPTITQCVGVASGPSPEGPFEPMSTPLVCQRDRRGSIDPRSFADRDGSLWLHWKSDDNADTEGTAHTTIYAQRLAPDGLSLTGQPVRILEADQVWEGRIVEAPDMILVGGRYWLFYSGNWFNQPAYAIGVAECAGPAGPCTKHRRTPWLASNAQGNGPGESSLFVDRHGATWTVYNPQAQDGTNPTPRATAMARVAFGPDGPYLAAP